MPKIVDHEQRRTAIVSTFLSLVEQRGLDGATSRALAAELGISNSLLWRYFSDMDALIERAYREVVAHTNARVAQSIDGRTGLAAAYALIDELFPVTTANCWRLKLVDFLTEASAAGEIPADAPVHTLANAVMGIVGNAQIEYAMSGDDHVALAARDLARSVVRLH